jgi:hypothetical protein
LIGLNGDQEQAMELVERIARVIAGYRLSANAAGVVESAAEAVDSEWAAHQDEAVAILKALRDPSPTIEETGMAQEWKVLIEREVALANGDEHDDRRI